MEIVPEGKNFRLVTEDELPAVADVLVQYMPESLKVINKNNLLYNTRPTAGHRFLRDIGHSQSRLLKIWVGDFSYLRRIK